MTSHKFWIIRPPSVTQKNYFYLPLQLHYQKSAERSGVYFSYNQVVERHWAELFYHKKFQRGPQIFTEKLEKN
jgi:hypothetical protein